MRSFLRTGVAFYAYIVGPILYALGDALASAGQRLMRRAEEP
jgi:hypothetical protein